MFFHGLGLTRACVFAGFSLSMPHRANSVDLCKFTCFENLKSTRSVVGAIGG